MSMPDPIASSALILSREASMGKWERSSLLWSDWEREGSLIHQRLNCNVK